jgi:hypothetical protein
MRSLFLIFLASLMTACYASSVVTSGPSPIRPSRLHQSPPSGQSRFSHRPTEQPYPTFVSRNDIAAFLQLSNFTTGAEVGVQVGGFSKHNLKYWKSCRAYHMIDLWGYQSNYLDAANVDQEAQERNYKEAQEAVKLWRNITVFHRNYSVDAAKLIPDASLDFIYLDARHDFCGVTDDLEAYYPKLKPGGMFAGHDYLDAREVQLRRPKQSFYLCQNGTKHPGAVKGAVKLFAEARNLKIQETQLNFAWGEWPTWMIKKPPL